MEKIEVANGFDRSAKVARYLFLLLSITLCSLTTNVSAESFSFPEGISAGKKTTVIPVSQPIQNRPSYRTNLDETGLIDTAEREARFRGYVVGGHQKGRFKGILPALNDLEVKLQEPQFRDSARINDLRSLVKQVKNTVVQLVVSNQYTPEQIYRKIKDEVTPQVLDELRQYKGSLSAKLVHLLSTAPWPE